MPKPRLDDHSPASEGDKRFTLSHSLRTRLHAADLFAYGGMFAAAGPTTGSGRAFVAEPGTAMAMWNPADESCAYNTLLGFEYATDLDAAWAEGRAAARAGHARVFGVGVMEESAAWATPDRLAAEGLEIEYEEFVWGRPLDPGFAPLPDPASPPGVLLMTDDLDPAQFAAVLNRGWEVAPEHGRGPLYAATIGLPGWTNYLALADGQPAGAGSLCIQAGVALCMVAAVDPAYRGRGIQRHLIARRLADASAAGCDFAASETVDDNASPRNFKRAGFHLLHHRLMYRVEL